MADADDAGADESARRKSHASRMFRWEDQLARDHGLSNFAVRFGVVIRSCVDATTGSARASDVSYAKRLGIWKEPPSDRKTKFYEDGTRIIRRTKIELVERHHLKKGPGKCLTPILREQREANANPDSGARVSPSQTRAQESGFETEDIRVAPGKPGHGSPPTRTPESENPGSGVPVLHLSESSSDSSTTRASSLSPTEVFEDDDGRILAEIARVHGYRPAKNVLKCWRGNFFTARVRGIDPAVHLLAAVRSALIAASRRGSDRLTPTTDLMGRFEKPATKFLETWNRAPRDTEELFEAWECHANDIIAARHQSPAQPKAHAKKFTQRQQDDRRRKRHLVMQALSLPVSLTTKAPWLTNEITQLEAAGLSVEAIVGACRRAGAPGSLDNLKQQGGLSALVQRQLRVGAHPSPSTLQ